MAEWSPEQFDQASKLLPQVKDPAKQTSLQTKINEYKKLHDSVNKTPGGTLINDTPGTEGANEVNFGGEAATYNPRFVYEAPARHVREVLAKDPSMLGRIGIKTQLAPGDLGKLQDGDTITEAYNNYKWNESVERARKDGLNIIRYSKLGWKDDTVRKLLGATMKAGGALVMGIDDAMLGVPGYVGSHIQQNAGQANAVEDYERAKEDAGEGPLQNPMRFAGQLLGFTNPMSPAGAATSAAAKAAGYAGKGMLGKAGAAAAAGLTGGAVQGGGTEAVKQTLGTKEFDPGAIEDETITGGVAGGLLGGPLDLLGQAAARGSGFIRELPRYSNLNRGERGGITTDPINGVDIPQEIENNLKGSVQGRGSAVDIATEKVAPKIADKLESKDRELTLEISKNLENYFQSPEGQTPYPVTGAVRDGKKTAGPVDTIINYVSKGLVKRPMGGHRDIDPTQAKALRSRLNNLVDRVDVPESEAQRLAQEHDGIIMDPEHADLVLTGQSNQGKQPDLSGQYSGGKQPPETVGGAQGAPSPTPGKPPAGLLEQSNAQFGEPVVAREKWLNSPENSQDLNKTINQLGLETKEKNANIYDTAKKLFGRDLNYDEIKGLVGDTSIGKVSGSVSAQDGALTLNIEGDNGVKMLRSISKAPSGNLTAYHIILGVPEELQGTGIGSRLIADQLSAYKKLGVGEVVVDPAAVGIYTWAKMGFDTDMKNLSGVMDAYDSWLRSKGMTWESARQLSDSVKSLKELADSEQGKEFLLSGKLYGLPELKIDLNNPQQMGIVKSYLEKKNGGKAFSDLVDAATNKLNLRGEFKSSDQKARTPNGEKLKTVLIPQKLNAEQLKVAEDQISRDLGYSRSSEGKDDPVLKTIEHSFKNVRDKFKPNQYTPYKETLDDGTEVTGLSALQRKHKNQLDELESAKAAGGTKAERTHKRVAQYTGNTQGEMLNERELQKLAGEAGSSRELEQVAATGVAPALRSQANLGGAANLLGTPGAVADAITMRLDPLLRAAGGVPPNPYGRNTDADKIFRELFQLRGGKPGARLSQEAKQEYLKDERKR